MYGRENLSNDLPKNVELIWQKNQRQIAQLYLESAFSLSFTNPELIHETFGKSAWESQLCWCPVIGLKNWWLNSTILNSNVNLKIEWFDLEKIIDFIEKNHTAFFNDDIREKLSKKANNQFFNRWHVAWLYLWKVNDLIIESLTKKISHEFDLKNYIIKT